VDGFVNIESAIVRTQYAIVTAEQTAINLGVQLPPAIVSYFTQVDDALLEIDNGLAGAPGSTGALGGIDSLLLTLPALPADEVARIQSLATQVQQGQQAVTAAEAAIQKTNGPVTPAALDFFAELPGMQTKFYERFAEVGLRFALIEGQLIGLDPSSAMLQDAKNISDGAAKGQAAN
jgi:hypothetical protein